MSGPADSLLIAANSKDIALLEDQSKSIIGLAKSMMLVSQDALQGYSETENHRNRLIVTFSGALTKRRLKLSLKRPKLCKTCHQSW